MDTNLASLMKQASVAIRLDSENKLFEAYTEYLQCLSGISSHLLHHATTHKDGVFVPTTANKRCIDLGQQCMERLATLVQKLEDQKETDAQAESRSSFIAAEVPEYVHDDESNVLQKAEVKSKNETPAWLLSQPPPPLQLYSGQETYNRQTKLSSGRATAHLDMAYKQNERLMAAYKARMEKMHGVAAANLTLTLQRKMMENLALGKAKQEALAKKMRDRQHRLEVQTARRFAFGVPIGLSKEDQEQRHIYKLILEYEQDVQWLVVWRDKLALHPDDPLLIQQLIHQILKCADHPLTQLLKSYQIKVYQKIYPLVADGMKHINKITVPLPESAMHSGINASPDTIAAFDDVNQPSSDLPDLNHVSDNPDIVTIPELPDFHIESQHPDYVSVSAMPDIPIDDKGDDDDSVSYGTIDDKIQNNVSVSELPDSTNEDKAQDDVSLSVLPDFPVGDKRQDEVSVSDLPDFPKEEKSEDGVSVSEFPDLTVDNKSPDDVSMSKVVELDSIDKQEVMTISVLTNVDSDIDSDVCVVNETDLSNSISSNEPPHDEASMSNLPKVIAGEISDTMSHLQDSSSHKASEEHMSLSQLPDYKNTTVIENSVDKTLEESAIINNERDICSVYSGGMNTSDNDHGIVEANCDNPISCDSSDSEVQICEQQQPDSDHVEQVLSGKLEASVDFQDETDAELKCNNTNESCLNKPKEDSDININETGQLVEAKFGSNHVIVSCSDEQPSQIDADLPERSSNNDTDSERHVNINSNIDTNTSSQDAECNDATLTDSQDELCKDTEMSDSQDVKCIVAAIVDSKDERYKDGGMADSQDVECKDAGMAAYQNVECKDAGMADFQNVECNGAVMADSNIDDNKELHSLTGSLNNNTSVPEPDSSLADDSSQTHLSLDGPVVAGDGQSVESPAIAKLDTSTLSVVFANIKQDLKTAITESETLQDTLKRENTSLFSMSYSLDFDDQDDIFDEIMDDDSDGKEDVMEPEFCNLSADSKASLATGISDVIHDDTSVKEHSDSAVGGHDSGVDTSDHDRVSLNADLKSQSASETDTGDVNYTTSSFKRSSSIPIETQNSFVEQLHNDEYTRHLCSITEDVHTFMEKLMLMFLVAYEQLDSPVGRDQCYASLEEPFFDPIWLYLLSLFRLSNQPKEFSIAQLMTSMADSLPQDMNVSNKLCLVSPARDTVPYNAAIAHLQNIATSTSPLAKLECLVSVSHLICQAVEDYYKHAGKHTPIIGADDLLPILCYVIIRSKMPAIVSECHALEEFVHEGYLMGEEGYCLTSVRTAIGYIISLAQTDPPQHQ